VGQSRAAPQTRVPVPTGRGSGSGPPDRGTPVEPARPVGRLPRVAEGGPAEPRAGARDQIVHRRRAGRFEEDTVAALADLLFGEGRLERLDDR
jgi:hypothetical protein